MKKILLITTGGTIASVAGENGLAPMGSGILSGEIDRLREYYDITVRDLMCLDCQIYNPRSG